MKRALRELLREPHGRDARGRVDDDVARRDLHRRAEHRLSVGHPARAIEAPHARPRATDAREARRVEALVRREVARVLRAQPRVEERADVGLGDGRGGVGLASTAAAGVTLASVAVGEALADSPVEADDAGAAGAAGRAHPRAMTIEAAAVRSFIVGAFNRGVVRW